MPRKKKGFTLIELISVLVIMAILALIVTPLVLNIIRKARTAADKRSIDAYGRSIEIAIASYLLDTGTFPTALNQLTIEYSGPAVECSTEQLNSDSSVYLSGCTVAGRTVDYAYGTDKSPTYQAYSVGDTVTYNSVNYYVIKDSGAKESTVTLLKAEPLTVSEVNTYGGVGTDNNHVNMYIDSYEDFYQTAKDIKSDGTIGGMAYYSSDTCGIVNDEVVRTGCTASYSTSDIKYVVDAWKLSQVPSAIEARLISYDELVNALGCASNNCLISSYKWVCNNIYYYWSMTQDDTDVSRVFTVTTDGYVTTNNVSYQYFAVRPVIVLPKSVIQNQ